MKKSIILTAIFSLFASLAQAQEKFATDTLKTKVLRSNFSPFGGKALSNVLSNIAVSSALNEGENGKIELKYNKNAWTAGLSVDQKLGKGAKDATFYDFTDGISPGTTVGFNLQTMLWKPDIDGDDFKKFDQIRNIYAKSKGLDPRTVTANDLMEGASVADRKAILKMLKQPVFFNLKLAFTKTSFSYAVDSISLKANDVNFITPDVRFSVGLPSRDMSGYLSLSYLFTENYKAASDQTFYSPFGTTKNQYARTLAFGKPLLKTDHKLVMEWRKNFQRGEAEPDFAIDPTLTYGVNSNIVAIAIPLYFIKGATAKDKPKGLQGGVSLGYFSKLNGLSSFKDGFGAQLVLTTPLDILGALK